MSAPDAPSFQAQYNISRWARGRFVAEYANRALRPAEVVVLVRHREALAGRVLELGCGAGRVTGYLAAFARHVTAIDVSPAMVERCGRDFPEVEARVGDLRDLSAYEPGSFDAVVAAYNVVDVLDDTERRRLLDAVHGVLAEGGLLVMSSHNEAHIPFNRKPTDVDAHNWMRAAMNAARVPLRVRNRRRVVSQERRHDGYAIVNDEAHDFAVLHYYIMPPAQARQLVEHGFEPVEALDGEGRALTPGDLAPESAEIHYVARRSSRPPVPPQTSR